MLISSTKRRSNLLPGRCRSKSPASSYRLLIILNMNLQYKKFCIKSIEPLNATRSNTRTFGLSGEELLFASGVLAFDKRGLLQLVSGTSPTSKT